MPYTTVTSVVAGNKGTATWGNEVADAIGELQVAVPEAVTTWPTPINGGITAGDGTTVARYAQVGPVTFCYFKFTLGATSAITGDVSLLLPAVTTVQRLMGNAYYEDASAGTARTLGVAIQLGANNTVILRFGDASTTELGETALSSTAPFTWATGDIIVVNFWYFHV